MGLLLCPSPFKGSAGQCIREEALELDCWVGLTVLSLTCCMTSGTFLKLWIYVHGFFTCKVRNDSSNYLTVFLSGFSSVQLLSCVWLFAAQWTAARQASLSITNSQSLLRLMSIMLVMPSNHLILCRPLQLPPSIFPSIGVFSNESVLHIRWPKYWSFNISPSNEYSFISLISFRMDQLDLLAGQGTLKSLLQHHSSKASILRRSAFFIVQLSHLYVTGKTIALTRWIFFGKVMSLLFSMLRGLDKLKCLKTLE